jgi:RNA polymerase sigma factor (TIGR02999 family)
MSPNCWTRPRPATRRLRPSCCHSSTTGCALAAARLAYEKPGQTLQATALVHEAYLRLVGSADRAWDSRGHFFAAAAEAMRRVLVDRARAARSEKRGGRLTRLDVDAVDVAVTARRSS